MVPKSVSKIIALFLFLTTYSDGKTVCDELSTATYYNVSKFLSISYVKSQCAAPGAKYIVFAIINSGMPNLNDKQLQEIGKEHLRQQKLDAVYSLEKDYGFGEFMLVSVDPSYFLFWKGEGSKDNPEYANQLPLLDSGRIVKGDNGIAYFLSQPFSPAGVFNKYFYADDPEIFLARPDLTKMKKSCLDFSSQAPYNSFVDKFKENQDATYFATNDSGWEIALQMNKQLEDIFKVLQDHVVFGTPYFIHYPAGKKPKFYEIKGVPKKIIFRNVKGEDYVISNQVKSPVAEKNIAIKGGVAHVLSWPVGVRSGNVEAVLSTKAKVFLEKCKSESSCAKKLNPSHSNNTVAAPQDSTALKDKTSKDLEQILSLHFLNLSVTEFDMETAFYNQHYLYTDSYVKVRSNMDQTNTYLELRDLSGSTAVGYISSKVEAFDIAGEKGNIQIISQPFGIYSFDIMTYLKSRPQFSKFLMYAKEIFPLLSGKTVTLFAPTNEAFEKMWTDFPKNGYSILQHKAAYIWVLKRHFIPGDRVMMEEMKISKSDCKAYKTFNTPSVNDKEEVQLCHVQEKGKSVGKFQIPKYEVVTFDLFKGGYGVSNGIIYPINKVLYITTDVNARYLVNGVGRMVGSTAKKLVLIGIFILFTYRHF